jgi:hypothetical protein
MQRMAVISKIDNIQKGFSSLLNFHFPWGYDSVGKETRDFIDRDKIVAS